MNNPPQNQYPQPPAKQGMNTTLKVILIVLGVFVLLGVGCVALVGKAANDVVEGIEEAEDDRQKDEALVEDNAKIVECEKDSTTGWWVAQVEFTNPLDEEKGYISVEVNFLNSEGTVVANAVASFENLSAGQKAKGEANSLEELSDEQGITCEIVDGTVF